MSHGSGRKLFGSPVLLQDWDSEAEEGAAQYWELFLDLLLVAAASSIADHFKENLDGAGFEEFVIFFLILMNAWLLYTHHYSTRFEDSSLAHSMVLFVYVLGFGICIVNPGYENAAEFAVGCLIQRGAVLFMLATTADCLPRARHLIAWLSSIIGFAMLGLVLALWGAVHTTTDDEETIPIVVRAGFWIAGAVEFLVEVLIVYWVDGRRLVPINIEQSKERLGALELIMMGETVLSVTLTYRELQETSTVSRTLYYWVLGLAFLLVFMFLLLFFHMQPVPSEHAFRRSRFHGTTLMVLYKVLALALLAVGVSIKLVVEAVLLQEVFSDYAARLMGYCIGVAMLTLFLMRWMHYGGKDSICFGTKTLTKGEHPDLDRLATLWWWTVGLAWLLPFVGIATGITMKNPLAATGWHAGLLFVLCVLETTYSHRIEDVLTEIVADTDSAIGERQSLTTASAPTSYQGRASAG